MIVGNEQGGKQIFCVNEISKLTCDAWNPFVVDIFHVTFIVIVMMDNETSSIGPFIIVLLSILLTHACQSF